jgi:hypothetical protein
MYIIYSKLMRKELTIIAMSVKDRMYSFDARPVYIYE